MADDTALRDSLKATAPLSKATAKATSDLLTDLEHPAQHRKELEGTAGMMVTAAHSVFVNVLVWLAKSASALFAQFLSVLTDVRKQTFPQQVEIGTAILSELFAADISPAHVRSGKTKEESVAAAQAVGLALLNRLESMFAPSGRVDPSSGAAGAATFMGFGINYGVQEAFFGSIVDATSYHLLEKLGDIGPDIAQNIGLGRLVRQALRPLVQETIATPYGKQMKAKYRQDTLSEAQLIRGMVTGAFSEQYVREQLAEKGYADGLINELIRQLTPRLTDTELERLIRYGTITHTQAMKALSDAGVPDNIAAARLDAIALGRVDSVISTYVSTLRSQVAAEFLTLGEFRSALDTLPLNQAEKDWQLRIAQQKLEIPRKRPTLAQVRTMLAEGIVDLNYMDKWLDAEGYSDDDALNIQLLELLQVADDAAKQAAKDARKKAADDKKKRKAAGG